MVESISREAVLLFGGGLFLVVLAFVGSRVIRSLDHGFSIRLQLFFAIWITSLLATGVIGLWVIDRLQVRAAELAVNEGPSMEVVLELLREFGPKITLLIALLGIAAAGAAFAFGRAVAEPIERLTQSAEAIARGERYGSLPPPTGREVRRLTGAFESMRRSLEDRHYIEEFVADLSHELRNPVSAIRAATEVLMEGAAEDDAARPRFLARIDQAGRRLEVLIDDLLVLARLEARGVTIDREIVRLDEIVRSAIEGQSAALEARSLDCRVDVCAVRMSGNPHWLRRAVENLLVNAIRYSPDHGRVEVSLDANDAIASVKVRDYGVGVADHLRGQVFERFVTDRKGTDQTGLGLAIVRSVAEVHGGAARLVEVDGPGACFELTVSLG